MKPTLHCYMLSVTLLMIMIQVSLLCITLHFWRQSWAVLVFDLEIRLDLA